MIVPVKCEPSAYRSRPSFGVRKDPFAYREYRKRDALRDQQGGGFPGALERMQKRV